MSICVVIVVSPPSPLLLSALLLFSFLLLLHVFQIEFTNFWPSLALLSLPTKFCIRRSLATNFFGI